ncbi:MAG: hypothetical protein IKH45_07705 [Neisseriaceae bacterium]|nr:hypothetical protein [Neisseriaceae bacterium]
MFRLPESTSRAGNLSLRADRQALAVLLLTPVSLRDLNEVQIVATHLT